MVSQRSHPHSPHRKCFLFFWGKVGKVAQQFQREKYTELTELIKLTCALKRLLWS